MTYVLVFQRIRRNHALQLSLCNPCKENIRTFSDCMKFQRMCHLQSVLPFLRIVPGISTVFAVLEVRSLRTSTSPSTMAFFVHLEYWCCINISKLNTFYLMPSGIPVSDIYTCSLGFTCLPRIAFWIGGSVGYKIMAI